MSGQNRATGETDRATFCHPMTPAILAGLTGVLQGARHALEPDHITAVATVMVEVPSPQQYDEAGHNIGYGVT